MKGSSIYLISHIITGSNIGNYFTATCFVKFLTEDYFENLKIQKQHCFEIIWYVCILYLNLFHFGSHFKTSPYQVKYMFSITVTEFLISVTVSK